PNELDRSSLHRARLASGQVRLVIRLAQRELRQGVFRVASAFLSRADRLWHAAEIRRGETPERRVDDDVGARQFLTLLESPASNQNRECLIRHLQRRGELLACIQRK